MSAAVRRIAWGLALAALAACGWLGQRPRGGFVARGGHLQVELRLRVVDHAAVREQIDGQMFRLHPRVLVMRLDGVTFMDSSGLGLVVGRLRVARELGSELRITGADRQKMRIFSLAGLERMPGLKIEQASGL